MRESLHTARVGSLVTRPPLTCKPGMPVVDVAASMDAHPARAAVVLDDAGAPAGIVTDRDLRAKVLALRRDPACTTALDIMSTPLATIDETAFAFDALLEMTRREIHHLVVVRDGIARGVLTSDDLLGLPATHPVLLAREISRTTTVSDLAQLAARITELVRALVAQGTRAREIAAIVAELNDRLVARALVLAEATIVTQRGAGAPAPYAWLLFGSEGRREQTLRTDQDNGLVYADDVEPARAAWFSDLAREAIDALIAIGFPPCPGGAMASNPAWCQPISVWERYFITWLNEPTPAHVLAASMYFDVRPLSEGEPLGGRLRSLVRHEGPRHRHFLSAMAREVVDRALPRTVLGNVRVARSGPHRGTVDLKSGGSIQLVAAARTHALELGYAETGTVPRFEAAAGAGVYDADALARIVDAYDHLLHLRLAAQLEHLQAGTPPDNRVDPRRLPPRDRLLLRAAFDAAALVQETVRDRYRTDLVG